jgi:DNA-directed RNA polymerase subunit M/transcription elongation factor TFIIS
MQDSTFVRDRATVAIRDALLRSFSADDGRHEEAARVIERSAYNLAIRKALDKGVPRAWGNRRFNSQYEQCTVYCIRNAASMMALMDSRAVADKDVACSTSQTLRPDVWGPLVAEKLARDAEANKASQLKPNTKSFACGRCKSRQCYFYEMQTRSADEPMSMFLTCLDCGHRWRIG